MESIFSPLWYRVANLKPRLRPHTHIHCHQYRGRLWYVLQDHSSGRFHWLSPETHRILSLMNGQRTVHEVWEAVGRTPGVELPGQADVVRLLGQLHGVDALQCDMPPDTLEIFRRFRTQRWAEWKRRLKQPFAIRIPLFDPESLLEYLSPLAHFLWSWAGVAIWVSVVGIALLLLPMHWDELTTGIADRVFSAQNLVLLWFVYPVVKAFHEMGHGLAVKARGGEVHEIGIMLLIFMPVPYVDASAASAFRNKRHRMVVGAAGILVEVFLAALAFLAWLNVEPGIVRAAAYNVMLIGGVSTLFFNGNPLLRFDGYYVFMDAVEIPNLGARANKYIAYLIQRYLLGAPDPDSPAQVPGERRWFVFYGIAAFVYRIFIMLAITLFVATRFFFIGTILAIWFLINSVVTPVIKQLKFLFTSPLIRKSRRRAITVSAVILGTILGLLGLVPMPCTTRATGVVWLPEEAQVRAGTEGFIQEILKTSGTFVRRGEPVLLGKFPFLEAEAGILESQLREIKVRYDTYRSNKDDRVQALIAREEMSAVTNDLMDAKERLEKLTIRSPSDGRLVIPKEKDIRGRFVNQGQTLAYVLDPGGAIVRAALSQDDVGMVRERTVGVYARVPGRVEEILSAAVVREVPSGAEELPSIALGSAGGGDIAVDPRDPAGTRALEKVFLFDIAISDGALLTNVGGRVHVQFDHGKEPLLGQWYRRLRQLFLRKFQV